MAWQLVLRVGDTTTYDVVLTSGYCFVTEYPLASPALNQEAIASMGDGNSLSVPTFTNVTESIDLHIQAATPALVTDVVREIERVIDIARQGSIGNLVDKVYLLVKFDHDALWWRSQILAAQWSGPAAVERIHKNYTTGTIALTRRYYWETVDMQAVAITSGTNTTPTTGFVQVYNSDDTHGVQRNWFQIDAGQVIGSLPAPAKIIIRNASGGTLAATSFYLGNYVFNDPTNVDPIYRHEDAGSVDTTPGTTEQNIYSWNLSSTGLVDDFRGQFGRFVVVWSDRPSVNTLLRAAVMYGDPNPLVVMALGEQMLDNPNSFVMDLGALPIPPAQWISGMGENIHLVLKAKAATGTDALGVDWLQIFPSGAGRYRVLHSIVSMNLSAANDVIDDGPERSVYLLDNAAGKKLPLYRPMYEPIHLWPHLTQRIRMIVSSALFPMEPGQLWHVNVSYRARRLTL